MFNTSPDRLTCTASPQSGSRRKSSATLYWPAMDSSSAPICWQKIRAGADRGQDDQVAALGVHLLAAAYRAGDDLAWFKFGFSGFFRFWRGQIDQAFACAGGRQHG